MQISGPVFLKGRGAVSIAVIAQSSDVVGQGVQPHIGDMLGIKTYGNAPVKGGSGYAEILKARKQEVVHHLILPGYRLDKFRVLVDVVDEPRSVLAHAEEISLLLGRLYLAAAVGTLAVHQLGLREKGLAGGAVKALVVSLINISLIVKALENLLNLGLVVLVRGADELIIGGVHQVPDPLNLRRSLVHKLLGRHPCGLSLLLDLLTVLIGAGLEKYISALGPLIAGNGVRQHDLVGIADMGLAGGVGDGGGNIIWLLAVFTHLSFPHFH